MAVPRRQSTETMSVSEARKNFSDVVTRPLRGEGRVIVEKSGTPVGAIVSIEDVRRLEQLDRERAEQMAELRDALQATRQAFAGIPPEEIEQEILKALADVKSERRTQRQPASDPIQ